MGQIGNNYFPDDMPIPHIFVSTSYRGVAPSDMETAITIEIEKKLKGIDGLKNLKSVSSEGESLIDVEFSTDVDIDDALRKVKDKVDEARNDLPNDLEDDPFVFEVNLSEMPILIFSLSGTCKKGVRFILSNNPDTGIKKNKGSSLLLTHSSVMLPANYERSAHKSTFQSSL